ncbi:MAG: Lrp/AsnC family transcriptional regulator [Alphaproteobacteria bacterium]|nr:Lrp/AsnC family transcriptional regulator [Alphaproteobacteria bacterium]
MTKANDAIDRKLLSLLQANAREPTTTLAKKLGIARTTVQERIARLQRNGTISGYSVVLRRDPYDQCAEVVVLLGVTHRRQKAVVELLRDFPEIKLCQTINGDYELLCRVKVAQLEDIHPVLEALAEIPGVERVKSTIVLSTNFDRSQSEASSLAVLKAVAMDQGEAG